MAAPLESGSGWHNFLDPPYFGPIDVQTPGRKIPAFSDSEEVLLDIAVPGPSRLCRPGVMETD